MQLELDWLGMLTEPRANVTGTRTHFIVSLLYFALDRFCEEADAALARHGPFVDGRFSSLPDWQIARGTIRQLLTAHLFVRCCRGESREA